MNSEQFSTLKEEYGDELVLRYCKWIDPNDPNEISHIDQLARKRGDHQDNLDRMQISFKEGDDNGYPPQKTPVSRCETTIKDGCTRTRAAQLNGQKLWVCDFLHEKLLFNSDQWEDWYDSANDHPTCAPATPDDILYRIQERVDSGRVQRDVAEFCKENNIPLPNRKKDPELWAQLAGKVLKPIWPNSQVSQDRMANKVYKVLVSTDREKSSGTFNKTQADEYVKNTFDGHSLLKQKEPIQDGVWYFHLNNISRISPNYSGALSEQIFKDRDSQEMKTIRVILNFAISLKNNSPIDTQRREAMKKITERFVHFGYDKKYNLEFYATPQKNSENNLRLVRL